MIRKTQIAAIAFSLCAAAGTAQATTILQDTFGDGNLGTNPGIGNGFVSHGQSGVTESSGAMQFPGGGSATRVTKSIDSFDPFQTGVVTQMQWDFSAAPINQTSFVDRSRFRVGVDQNASTGDHWLGGFAVEIDWREVASTAGSVGRITNGGNILAEWTYQASATGNGPLTITLQTTDTSYDLSLSAAINLTSGSLSGALAGMADTTWYLGAHSQFVNPASIDTITVSTASVPAPAGLGLLLSGLIGLGYRRLKA